MEEQKKILVFFGPSGAGKGEASRYALSQYSDVLAFSISDATRAPRTTEVEGKDYHFDASEDRAQKFLERVREGKYLEWQQVYPNDDGYRGTPESEIYRIWGLGKIPVLDIDVEGANNVKKRFPQETTRILLRPHSWELWYEKLCARHVKDGGSLIDPKFIARLVKAKPEVRRARASGFEREIVNYYDDRFFNTADNIVHQVLGRRSPFLST